MKILNQVLTVSLAFFLSACASVGTHTKKVSGGLVYFMPKKNFVIKVSTTSSKESAPKESAPKESAPKESAPKESTAEENASKEGDPTTVVSTVTDAYPDFSKQYVLTYKFNLFGDNEIDLGINERGLLTSAKATTVSKVNEALGNLGKSAGVAASLAAKPSSPALSCRNEGEYTFIYDEPVTVLVDEKLCDDLKLKIEKIGDYKKDMIEMKPGEESAEDEEIKYGIYYRQLVPYKITVTNNRTIHHENIVYIPSSSKTHFLPISRTFFANNEIDFGFTDGIPTKYVQKTNSELVGLFMLPGSLIGGFLEGVTSGFEKIIGVKEKETDLAEKSSLREVAKLKHEKCIAALAAKNDDLAKDTCS